MYAAGGGDLWASKAEEVGMGSGDGWVYVIERWRFISVFQNACRVLFGTWAVFAGVFFVPGADGGPGTFALSSGWCFVGSSWRKVWESWLCVFVNACVEIGSIRQGLKAPFLCAV